MRRVVLLGVLGLLSLGASFGVLADIASGTPRFTWAAPTQDVNGHPLSSVSGAPNAIKEYRLFCDPAETTGTPKAVVSGPDLSYQSPIGMFSVGTHSCTVQAVLNSGKFSDPSNISNFIIPTLDADPKPPTGLTAQ